MSPAQIVLALAFTFACTYTLVAYPHKYGALSGRSRLFRTIGLFLLNLLLGLVLLYTFLDFGANASERVANFREITFLLACIFLGLALICIALLDWLESLVAYRRAQRQNLYDMAADENKPDDQDADPPAGSAGGKPGGAP